jgi:mono/diheme cytochrome c family protein
VKKTTMKKMILKRAGLLLAAVVAAAAAWALYVDVTGIPKYEGVTVPVMQVEVTPARVQQGRRFVTMLCAECHLDRATGRLTGKHMGEADGKFGDIWSKNITQHPERGIGTWTDGELALFLRTGLKKDGTYVPPWMPKLPHLSDEDLASVIAFLRSDDPLVAPSDVVSHDTKPSFFSKALTHTMIKPFDYPKQPIVTPPITDRVAYGKYMTYALDCYACHTTDVIKIDFMNPDRSPGYMAGGQLTHDANGEPIRTANLTPDGETGIGKWSEADFVRALKKGFRPDGRVLHYPMTPRVELTDAEAGAIYAYLRTIPAIQNPVARAVDPPASGEAGKKLYASYGCGSCHGTTGAGPGGADLRTANEHYPSDAELRAWIEDAPSKKPGTRMPAWKGVIKDEDYPPLMAYVRTLAQNDGRSAAR